MNKVNTLYIITREEWRNWLQENFDKLKEIWLIYPKVATGKKRILYNDAVEEALCFGWIDSTHKTFDKDHTIQRFSPRKPKSQFSQANKERLRWLIEQELIHPSIKNAMQEVIQREFLFPADIINAIKKDKFAWKNFQNFSDSYKRIRIAYIDGARKRPDEYKKRLLNFINKTHDNKLITGFGGIDKYY